MKILQKRPAAMTPTAKLFNDLIVQFMLAYMIFVNVYMFIKDNEEK